MTIVPLQILALLLTADLYQFCIAFKKMHLILVWNLHCLHLCSGCIVMCFVVVVFLENVLTSSYGNKYVYCFKVITSR